MAKPQTDEPIGTFSPGVKLAFLLIGPLAALALYMLLPTEYVNAAGKLVAFPAAGRACLSVVLWMALWWFTEAVPIAATSLLPVVLFPLLGIAKAGPTMAPYASGTVFLFLGGFLIAAGVSRWHLDRRIALTALKIVGTRCDAIVGGLMGAAAFMSMWVSNTATAAMMVPIAMAVLNLVRQSVGGDKLSEGEKGFGIALMLGIAFACSIGGVGTIIGSPPNGIYVKFMEQNYGIEVSLLDWMKVGVPVVLIAMPLCWFLLTKVCFRDTLPEVKGGAEWVRSELDKLGPMSNGEKAVAIVFLIAVVLWCTSSLLRSLTIGGIKPLAALSDNLIAMLCGVSLFCIPVDKKGGRCIDWSDCKTIPWDVLILFGGGLSMAAALQNTGAGEVIGAQATVLVGSPKLLIIAGVATLVAMTSNFTSNTALAATMLPLLAGVGAVLGVSNEIVLMTTAIAASFAFMMPVGTPPNAIVFSTGRLTIMHMVRAGAVISAACLMVLVGVVEIML